MSDAPSKTPSASIARLIAATLLPGLGPLWQRQWSLSLMMVFANVWLRLGIAGHTQHQSERLDTFLAGAFGFTGGLARPTAVFLTALVVGVHALAYWAEKHGHAKNKGATSV